MTKQTKYDVIVIGGGLAGLSLALHLSLKNKKILVLEKQSFPRHKVCGEYVSNEALGYLQSLGVDPYAYGAKPITQFEITTRKNQRITAQLPLGGFGMSRYALDALLAERAQLCGAEVLIETVDRIVFDKDSFTVGTKEGHSFKATFAVGSFGKRSNLDKTLNRTFIQKKSPYLAVKTHVAGHFPDNKVALHNFEGGYCGVSRVENNNINLCYIANYKTFKKHKSLQEFEENVLTQNPHLHQIIQDSTPVFTEPLTISQISFDRKPLIENHLLMCGDAAAMIHPLCGNGMGMAISSACMLSKLLLDFFDGKIQNRNQLEKMYLTRWKQAFASRLRMGHLMASIFKRDWATSGLWRLVYAFPRLVPAIIKKTHGKQIAPI